MPKNGQICTSIVVENNALEEFDETQNGDVCSCWVASQEGMNFQVRCKVEASHESFALLVYMDGAFMDGVLFDKNSFERERFIRGCPISADAIRLFAFSKVSMTDDETIASPEQRLSNLGTIEMKIWRVSVLGSSDFVYKERQISSNSVIHERSKKIGMHHVALRGTETSRKTQADVRYLDNIPFATSIFRYRPIEFLRAQGIVPLEKNADPSHPFSNTGGSSNDMLLQERKRKRRQRDAAEPSNMGNNDSDNDSVEQEIRNIRQQMLDMQQGLRHCNSGRVSRLKENSNARLSCLCPWIQMVLLILRTIDLFLRPRYYCLARLPPSFVFMLVQT